MQPFSSAKIKNIADEKGCTTAQLALAWVMAQKPNIVPIAGTKRRSYLKDNLGGLDVELSANDLAQIEAAFPADAVVGTRYNEMMMKSTNL